MRYEQIAVYIMATGYRGTIYVGVTSHLAKRAHEHRTHAVDGFTKRYGLTRLVFLNSTQPWSRQLVEKSVLKNTSVNKK